MGGGGGIVIVCDNSCMMSFASCVGSIFTRSEIRAHTDSSRARSVISGGVVTSSKYRSHPSVSLRPVIARQTATLVLRRYIARVDRIRTLLTVSPKGDVTLDCAIRRFDDTDTTVSKLPVIFHESLCTRELALPFWSVILRSSVNTEYMSRPYVVK